MVTESNNGLHINFSETSTMYLHILISPQNNDKFCYSNIRTAFVLAFGHILSIWSYKYNNYNFINSVVFILYLLLGFCKCFLSDSFSNNYGIYMGRDPIFWS